MTKVSAKTPPSRKYAHLYEEWRRLYVEEQMTVRGIAQKSGCGHIPVRNALVWMGVQIRGRKETQRMLSGADDHAEAWLQLAAQGVKGKEIARRYNVSKPVVYRVLAEHGVRLPATGGIVERPVADRFHEGYKVTMSGCWQWTGNVNKSGYGRIFDGRDVVLAHRLSYELHTGVTPGEKKVCHRCDNPPCVNPDHLFLGDMAKNVHDMIEKGRHAHGERVPQAKLTEAQVKAIRALHAAGEHRHVDLAELFGVSRRAIGQVVARRSWAHVD